MSVRIKKQQLQKDLVNAVGVYTHYIDQQIRGKKIEEIVGTDWEKRYNEADGFRTSVDGFVSIILGALDKNTVKAKGK